MRLLSAGLCFLIFFFPAFLEVSATNNLSKTSLKDFARIPHISGYSLSPNGHQMLFQKKSQEGRSLIVSQVTAKGLKPVFQHDLGSDLYESGAFWISNDRLFGYEARFVGDLPTREEEPTITVWVMHVDGSDRKILWEEKPRPLKKKRRKGKKRKPVHKVTFALMHSLPDEPDYVLVTRIEQTPEKRDDTELDVVSDIFRMNIDTGEMTLVTPDHGIEGARMFSWMPDESGFIRLGYGEVGKDDEPVLLVRKDANSSWTRLHDNELFKRGKFFPIGFGADLDVLYVSSSMATGRSVIYRFNIKRGRLQGKVFSHPQAGAGKLFFSKDRSRIEAVSYYDDEYRLEVLDDSFLERLDSIKAAVENSNVVLGDSDKDQTRQIVWVGDERTPGKPWLFFHDTGNAIALPEPAPWINDDKMASTESVQYRARDGVDIQRMLRDQSAYNEDDKDYIKVAGDLKKKELASISPAHMVENINSPVLIYHWEDSYYDVKHTRNFVKALGKAKKRFDYLEIDESEGADLYDATLDHRQFLELVESWLLRVNPTTLLEEANEAGKVLPMPKMTKSN